LSTISVYIGHSTIQALNSRVAPCFYTALVAQPSVGKSAALGLIQDAFDDLEIYHNIEDNDSQQINAPTIESLLDLLHRLPCCIGNLVFYQTI
jgi:hypothetical protein